MDKIKEKLSIKEPRDWGRVTSKEINNTSLLNRYKGSLYRCLQAVYQGLFMFYPH